MTKSEIFGGVANVRSYDAPHGKSGLVRDRMVRFERIDVTAQMRYS